MMTIEKITNILVDAMGIDAASITPDATFADLGLDSLDTVDLMMKLEEAFGVTIELSEAIKTVGDLVALIDGTGEGS
ncbi:MAG: acyl carrier protein [Clostridiales bacterium]|nr:acyl carrier protein [Clostridiales bacterium]